MTDTTAPPTVHLDADAFRTYAVDLANALEHLAVVAREASMGPGPFDHLTCIEAEALADVLRVAGYPNTAELVLSNHAEGDEDPEDMHRARYLEHNGMSPLTDHVGSKVRLYGNIVTLTDLADNDQVVVTFDDGDSGTFPESDIEPLPFEE